MQALYVFDTLGIVVAFQHNIRWGFSSEEEEYCFPDLASTIASISLKPLHNIPNASKNDCASCLRFTLLHACWSEATKLNVSDFALPTPPTLPFHWEPKIG